MKNLTQKQMKLLRPDSLRGMIGSKMTTKEIAKLCGVSYDTILERLKEYKII